MAMSIEQLRILRKPFPRKDHEFIRSFVYLTEEAIATRLEEADPSWTFELLNITYNGDQCVATARMTVCGVARDGVGMQKVNEKAGEAEKGAATDALKRCARLFGVGRYLLGAPDERQFDNWLANLTPIADRPNPNGVSRGNDSATWTQDDMKAFFTEWKKDGWKDADILATLGVSRLSEWTGTRAQADAKLNAHLDAQLREKAAAS